MHKQKSEISLPVIYWYTSFRVSLMYFLYHYNIRKIAAIFRRELWFVPKTSRGNWTRRVSLVQHAGTEYQLSSWIWNMGNGMILFSEIFDIPLFVTMILKIFELTVHCPVLVLWGLLLFSHLHIFTPSIHKLDMPPFLPLAVPKQRLFPFCEQKHDTLHLLMFLFLSCIILSWLIVTEVLVITLKQHAWRDTP